MSNPTLIEQTLQRIGKTDGSPTMNELGNTLFLTILVSMLSNTFSTIVSNATAEIQYRHAVQTLEGVKSDAIFAYQPPFNILALFILVPLRFVVSPRWFHKIHVFFVRLLNLPLLLIIAAAERRVLWPGASSPADSAEGGGSRYAAVFDDEEEENDNNKTKKGPVVPCYQWFWEKWRITTHGDIFAVFDLPPPEEIEDAISVDDELTHHMIRRHFVRNSTADSTNLEALIRNRKQQKHQQGQQGQQQKPQQQQPQNPGGTLATAESSVAATNTKGGGVNGGSGNSSNTAIAGSATGGAGVGSDGGGGGGGAGGVGSSKGSTTPAPGGTGTGKTLSRRDSMVPFPGLRQELQGILTDSEEMSGMTARLDALEESNARIEAMLARLVQDMGDGEFLATADDDDDREEEGDEGEGGGDDGTITRARGSRSRSSGGRRRRSDDIASPAEEGELQGRTGTLRDLDKSFGEEE